MAVTISLTNQIGTSISMRIVRDSKITPSRI